MSSDKKIFCTETDLTNLQSSASTLIKPSTWMPIFGTIRQDVFCLKNEKVSMELAALWSQIQMGLVRILN